VCFEEGEATARMAEYSFDGDDPVKGKLKLQAKLANLHSVFAEAKQDLQKRGMVLIVCECV
jgi:hypothetical protein